MVREIKASQLEDAEFFYAIDHPTITRGNSFKYYELGAMGVGMGGHPIVSLDQYFDTSMFPYINEELEEVVPKLKDHWVSMIPKGIVPTSVNLEPSLDSFLANPHRIWMKGYQEAIKNETGLVGIRKAIYERIGLTQGFKATLQLRNTTNFKNKTKPTTWKDISHFFPKLKTFVDSLPLEHVGYVNIMMYDKRRALPIHRDTFLTPHSEHFINVNFHSKPKPMFVYDEVAKHKHYLPEKTRCYFFNECDLHGVDRMDYESYTVRIDCKFKEALAEALGLVDGKVFDWSYGESNSPALIYHDTDV